MTIYKFTSYSDASFDVRPIEVEEKSKSYVTSDRFHINKSSINYLNKSTLFDEMYSTDNDPAVFLTAVIEKNKKSISNSWKKNSTKQKPLWKNGRICWKITVLLNNRAVIYKYIMKGASAMIIDRMLLDIDHIVLDDKDIAG